MNDAVVSERDPSGRDTCCDVEPKGHLLPVERLGAFLSDATNILRHAGRDNRDELKVPGGQGGVNKILCEPAQANK